MTGLPAVFPVRVQMLSDWIVGTGEGRVGDVDATVRRDADRLPFIPAKTLTGIWRDACEQAAAWLGGSPDGQDSPWQAWVDWIFGSQPDLTGDATARAARPPQPAAMALSPARLPAPVRAACRNRPALQAAAVFLRPGVAVDYETGVARDDMLRLEERARPGVLEAHASFTIPGGDLPRAAELLLRAGAAAVEGLGGKRNRGAGRCWLLVLDAASPPGRPPAPTAPRPADGRLAELAHDTALLDDPGHPPVPHRSAASLAVPAASQAIGPNDSTGRLPAHPERTVHRVTFEVVTPLVAQDRVLGNVVSSRESVPGSMLLPEILTRLDRQVGHQDLAVGDARPGVMDGDRAVPGCPAPMTWYRPKDRRRDDVVNVMERRPEAGDRRKAIQAGHVIPAGPGTWRLLAPEMAVSAHAVISDEEGRPTSDRGGVFTYLGLAPGTVLVSDIVLPSGVRLGLAAGDSLRLGRSRKDDFGEVVVRDVRQMPGPDEPGLAAGSEVRVWCVSEVLLRDGSGAWDPSPQGLASELARRLGVTVTVIGQQPGGLAVQACRASRRESFHTRWGRARPSLLGLAAGSVVTLRLGGAVTGEALAAVQRDGVGERTAEGFGQVRFDAIEVRAAGLRLEPTTGNAWWTHTDGGDTEMSGLPPAPDVLEQVAVSAQIARRVAEAVMAGADRIVPGAGNVSSRSQWGSLRQQLARLGTPGGREAVAHWLAQTREVRQRRSVWGLPALDALKRLLTEPAAVWAELGLDGPGLDEFVLGPGRADAVRESLWVHAVTVLVNEIGRDATRELQAADAGVGR